MTQDYLFLPNYNTPEHKSGVYTLFNVANNRRYIGSAIDLTARADRHFAMLQQGVHHNREMQNDFVTYGGAVFSFIVLEYCDVEYLTRREQVWLNRLARSCYNVQRKVRRTEDVKAGLLRSNFIRRIWHDPV